MPARVNGNSTAALVVTGCGNCNRKALSSSFRDKRFRSLHCAADSMLVDPFKSHLSRFNSALSDRMVGERNPMFLPLALVKSRGGKSTESMKECHHAAARPNTQQWHPIIHRLTLGLVGGVLVLLFLAKIFENESFMRATEQPASSRSTFVTPLAVI